MHVESLSFWKWFQLKYNVFDFFLVAMKIHVSSTTRNLLQLSDMFVLQERGAIAIKVWPINIYKCKQLTLRNDLVSCNVMHFAIQLRFEH